MRTIRLSIATLLLLAVSSSAYAFSITWAFQDTLFDDGSALTGSFDFDADIGAPGGYSNIDLQTSDGALAATSYTAFVLEDLSTDFRFFTAAGTQILAVTLSEAMTNAGGIIDVASGWLSAEISFGTWSYRFVETGSVVGVTGVAGTTIVPTVQLVEPTLLVIFIMGLAGVIVLRRRAII